MIKFEGLLTKFVQLKDCKEIIRNGDVVLICPSCADHEQGGSEFHDCKTMIYEDELDEQGRVVLHAEQPQCACYSEAHGTRND